MTRDPLSENVPTSLPEILRAAERGDWRMRAACLSMAGRIASTESPVWSAIGTVARRTPVLGRYIHAAGFQGRYVRGQVANGLVDRAWPVRVAAALALGDCRSPASIDALQPMLRGPFRAERIAAGAAIAACGGTVPASGSPPFDDGASAPPSVGDRTSSTNILTSLASAHMAVLDNWRRQSQPDPLDRTEGSDAAAWGRFLAGPPHAGHSRGLQAEIDRYDADGDQGYVLAKPFSSINRAQNTRLLHTFAAVCEHLHAPAQARVLDLGGGSGWVSELLAKLGYTPVTLDVSSALLSVGRRRFDRERLTSRSVAGDMTALPIADAAMSAVVVIDALHHVPDVSAVFREAFRVLEAGGAFLLAEPGEGHAETEKSRGEMLEFGVHEREIHVAEMFEYARLAGFDDVRVILNPAPTISMTSAQLDAATRSAEGGWRAMNGAHVTDLPAFIMQSVFDHPLFVCRKGRRPVDSTVPSVLRAGIEHHITRQGALVSGIVRVRNSGDTLWLRGVEHGHVQLGIQLLNAQSALLNRDFARASLPVAVAADQSVEVTIGVRLPDAETPYILKLDLVDEGVCWFEDVGSRPVYVPM